MLYSCIRIDPLEELFFTKELSEIKFKIATDLASPARPCVSNQMRGQQPLECVGETCILSN